MQDIEDALSWSRDHFGPNAAARYGRLIAAAISDLAANPERPGATARPELAKGIWTYHLYFGRSRIAGTATAVKNPRHLLVYRVREPYIEVVRVLHEAQELERHLPPGAGADG